MAYGRTNSGPVSNVQRSNTNTSTNNAAGGKPTVAAIFSTGLFAPREGSKSIATVQLKEAVTLPAGSYINMYEAETKVEGKPIFRLQVRPGQLKSK